MPWYRTSSAAACAALVVSLLSLAAATPAFADEAAPATEPTPTEMAETEAVLAPPVEPTASPETDPTPIATVEAVTTPPVFEPTATTPPRLAHFDVRREAAPRVVYGTTSTVRAALLTTTGHVLAGQRVVLLARFRPTDTWRSVAAGMTGSTGLVSLRATLPASAALRLHHPAGLVTAEDVRLRPVTVAKRVTVRPSRTHSRAGMVVRIPGRVAPDQRVGSKVRLQRRVSGSWQPVASGRMRTRGGYAMRWQPRRAGEYTLRVRKDGDALRAAGSSRSWRHRVKPEATVDIARDILRDDDITLATTHLSAGRDGATARANIVDIANGRRARTSCFSSAPCTRTRLDRRLLSALRMVGRRSTVTVSEIAGGAHAARSAHYRGRAFDVTWINGRHVGWGTSYRSTAAICRGHDADQVFTPSSDPWGGHSNHVHCAW